MAVVALLITGFGASTLKVKVALPVPDAFVAPRVTLDVPVTVGVPVIFPVPVFTLKPVGRPVALKLVGELVAVIE